MSVWAGLLIAAVAGMFAILVRRLPSAVRDVQGELNHPDEASAKSYSAQPVAKRRTLPKLDFSRLVFLAKAMFAQRPRRKPVLSPVDSQPRITETIAVDPLPSVEVEPPHEDVIEPQKKRAERPTHITEGAAEAAYQERNFEEAALIYEALIRQQPQNEAFYARLGLIYLELERFHDARDVFRTDLKFGDQVASRHFNLAMAEYGLGHRLTAVRYLKRAIALAPSNRKYHKLLDTFESERG